MIFCTFQTAQNVFQASKLQSPLFPVRGNLLLFVQKSLKRKIIIGVAKWDKRDTIELKIICTQSDCCKH